MDHNIKTIDERFRSYQFIRKQKIAIGIQQPLPPDLSYMVKNMPIEKVKILIFDYQKNYESRCYIRPRVIKELAKGHWPCLQILRIQDSQQLANNGCKQLAKLKAQQLKQINLSMCNIGDQGCFYLSKAKWPKLSTIILNNGYRANRIGDDGFVYIVEAGWIITYLSLYSNNIGAVGIKHMKKANWKDLLTLYLNLNKIGDDGCKWLSQTQLPCLKQLGLQDNKISKTGCKWLSKSNWKQIIKIRLQQNPIFWNGCRYLSNCNWPKITRLNLSENSILYEGCILLMKSNWKNLEQAQSFNNKIYKRNQIILQLSKKCFPSGIIKLS